MEPLLEADVDPDPFAQFDRWFAEATAALPAAEAMAVASADARARPSVRMVLLKGWDRRGFVFHTNFDSRKGREIADNPYAALLFHWAPLGRQVRIEGHVVHISDEESDGYFQTRPFGGQVGAHASHQSQPVDSRQELDQKVQRLTLRYADGDVPRPKWWGGLRVQPQAFEFWQSREDRLHDRLRYTPNDRGWHIDRLQP